jgi:puromycin-sensitive aminopeptidase
MHWALDEVKIQDFFYPMAGVSRSGKDGATCAWTFFQDNFEALQGKVKTANPSLFSAVIVYCCGGFASLERADEIEAFFKEHPVHHSAQRISQMLESIRVNGNFLVKVRTSALAKDDFWNEI